MGAILAIAGGVCGLLSAILALTLFGAGPVLALSIWSVTGLAAVAMGFLWSAMPTHHSAPIGA